MMVNVIEKLRELAVKVESANWPIVGDKYWEEIDNIIGAYKPEGYEVDQVYEETSEGGRWTTEVERVYKITQTDGKVAYFNVWRERPATEMQDGMDFQFSISEVIPKEVTVIQYEAGRSE